MARLPRATYATIIALLPAVATIIGIVVLTQIPSWIEVAGIVLVIVGVVAHRPPDAAHDAAPVMGDASGSPAPLGGDSVDLGGGRIAGGG